MTQPKPLTIIIVDKSASIKTLSIKDYKVEELYKKCGFKKSEDFILQVEWPIKLDGKRYYVQMYGKLDGKANTENKYDFPPPVDKHLYFGSCALIGLIKDEISGIKVHTNLSVELWNKIYEKLFGGFEDLALTCENDDDEEDELNNVPKHKKTKKGGYLKDGFVVDSSETEEEMESGSTEDEDEHESTGQSDLNGEEEEDILEELGSELSEEAYDYSDDKNT
jgi:hypothetical protein